MDLEKELQNLPVADAVRIEDDFANVFCCALANTLEVLVPLQVILDIEDCDSLSCHHGLALDSCPLEIVSKTRFLWTWNVFTALIRVIMIQ